MPVQESEASHLNDVDSAEQSAMSNGTSIVNNSFSNECKTDGLVQRPSGTTLKHSTGDPGVDAWISSLAASPVNPTRLPENSKGQPTSAIFGPPRGGSFARWDPDSCCWRMSQGCLLLEVPSAAQESFRGGENGLRGPSGHSTSLFTCVRLTNEARKLHGGNNPPRLPPDAYLESWPKTVMMRNSQLYLLQTLEPPICGSGFGSWPTPRAQEKCQHNSQDNGMALSAAVKMWPTPNTAPTRPCEGNVKMLRAKVDAGEMTEIEATAMLNGKSPYDAQGNIPQQEQFPTPTKRDWKDTGDPKMLMQYEHKKRLACTVAANDPSVTGSLNPEFVEWLMGWPRGWENLTSLPVDAEWPDPDLWGAEWNDVPRVSTGVPDRVNRLKVLGNGWVPQVALYVASRIKRSIQDERI